jgi:Zn-dependent oligopeptidase
MYEPSELSQMMRDMVTWSKETKSSLLKEEVINDVPKQFYDLANQKATRDEHKDAAFQGMVPEYLNALKGIDRKDSQQYYYNASIQACKTCHAVYCGGPLSVINQL